MKKRWILLLASVTVLIVAAFFVIRFWQGPAATAPSSSGQSVPPVDSVSASISAVASISSPSEAAASGMDSGAASSESESSASAQQVPAGWTQYALPLEDISATIALPEGLRINEEPEWEGRYIVQDSQVVPETITTLYTICQFNMLTSQELDVYQNADSESYVIFRMGNDETVSYNASLEIPYTYFYWQDYIVEHLPTPGIGGPYSHLGFIHLPTGLRLSFPFPPETPALDVFDYYATIVSTVTFMD